MTRAAMTATMGSPIMMALKSEWRAETTAHRLGAMLFGRRLLSPKMSRYNSANSRVYISAKATKK